MKKVTGIGGIFFKAEDPKKLNEWYKKHLDLPILPEGYFSFEWKEKDNPDETGSTVWSTFKKDTSYFNPGKAEFMINYRVENLEALLNELKEQGVEIAGEIQEFDYGKFAWIVDPEGNKIELWEPVKGAKS